MLKHSWSLLIATVIALPAGAQSSGVLLGLSGPERTNPYAEPERLSTYHTMWIVRDSVRPVRATIPDLLVPRADGFWRTGVVPFCKYQPGNAWARDSIWRAPLDSTVRILVDARCSDLEAQCGFAGLSFDFVGADYVAVSSYSGNSCDERGGRNETAVRTAAFLGDSALPVDTLGPDARAEFFRVMLDTTRRDPEMNCPAADEESLLNELAAWSIVHDLGRWVARAFTQYGFEGCNLGGVMEMPVPRLFTGPDALRPGWESIAARVDSLRDAVASPTGDMVVALTMDSLIVFESTPETLGRRLAAVHQPNGRIVMVQWALGRQVANWDSQVVRASGRTGVVLREVRGRP